MADFNRRELIEFAKGFVYEGLYDGFTHFCDHVGWQDWMENIKVNGIIEGILKAVWTDAENECEEEMLTVRGKTYAERKEDARNKAIDWQNYASCRNMCYGELLAREEYFEKVGKRFGLLAEFRENCIISKR